MPPAVPDNGLQYGFDSGATQSGSAWYAPATAPGYGPPTGDPAPGYGYAPATSGYGPPPAAPGYGYGYQPGYPPYGFAPGAKTNGLAIASLICSVLWMVGLGSVLAVIFGFVARSQIRDSDDGQRGEGLALAGIIIGFLGIIGTVLLISVAIAVDHHCHQTGNCTFTTLNTQN